MLSNLVENTELKNKNVCFINSLHETYIKKNGKLQWHKYNGNRICHKCYNKLVHVPKYTLVNNHKNNLIYHPRRLTFKNKRILLETNPRTGYCSQCSNNIFDRSCKRTHIHHIQYHEDDPLKDTVELCASCHNKKKYEITN